MPSNSSLTNRYDYWENVVFVLSVILIMITAETTVTTERNTQTVLAFHAPQVHLRPLVISSTSIARRVTITTLSNQIQCQRAYAAASCSVSLPFSLPSLSILKFAKNDNDEETNSLIWFQLVDPSNGNPYKNTRATKVSMPSTADVADFCKAVKVEYDYPEFLKDIPAATLLVYKNKAAYAAKDDPLKVSASLKGLGKDDEHNALIVAVPSLLTAKLNTTVVALQDVKVIDIEKCNAYDWIDTREIMKVTDFPEEYFVRKQSIDIFKILKNSVKPHTVLMGSPGVGKSLLLVLYCFWMAIAEVKVVLLVRSFGGEGSCMILLNGQNPSESWKMGVDDNNDIVPLVNQCRKYFPDCIVCLDGFRQGDDVLKRFEKYSFLSTSAQYTTKQDEALVVDRCLVPFWSLSDLKLVGQHKNWDDAYIKNRHYYSGGSLRYFLLPDERFMTEIEVIFGGVDFASAALLRTQYGPSADGQVDRIRMVTVNTDGLDNYKNPGQWSYVISSEFSLRKLSDYVTLDYYKDICDTAYMIKDDNLFASAFEQYFHKLTRQESVKLERRQYDRVKSRTPHTYEKMEFVCHKYLQKGNNEADLTDVMRSWTDELDYWYPENRNVTTIDSIAKIRGEFFVFQLTKSEKHSIDTTYLDTIANRLAVNQINYIAIVPNKAVCDKFRLKPADPLTTFPLNVAYINDKFFDKFVWKEETVKKAEKETEKMEKNKKTEKLKKEKKTKKMEKEKKTKKMEKEMKTVKKKKLVKKKKKKH